MIDNVFNLFASRISHSHYKGYSAALTLRPTVGDSSAPGRQLQEPTEYTLLHPDTRSKVQVKQILAGHVYLS